MNSVPFFVDVRDDDFTMDMESLEAGISSARSQGLRPRVVIPVDLFGCPADYNALRAVARRHDMRILADTAQGFGASYHGRRTGSLADASTTSFFPAKPLGCLGDGGAIFTDDEDLATLLSSLRVHGQGTDKYHNIRIGTNSRLDTLQAAILIEKLAIFEDELEARQRVAQRYSDLLDGVVRVPRLSPGRTSAWAQYTLVTDRRDAVASACKAAGIPTAVYYPIPLHQQPGYAGFPVAPTGCPVSERLSQNVISLPMHPYLDEATQDVIVATVRGALTA